MAATQVDQEGLPYLALVRCASKMLSFMTDVHSQSVTTRDQDIQRVHGTFQKEQWTVSYGPRVKKYAITRGSKYLVMHCEEKEVLQFLAKAHEGKRANEVSTKAEEPSHIYWKTRPYIDDLRAVYLHQKQLHEDFDASELLFKSCKTLEDIEKVLLRVAKEEGNTLLPTAVLSARGAACRRVVGKGATVEAAALKCPEWARRVTAQVREAEPIYRAYDQAMTKLEADGLCPEAVTREARKEFEQ